MARKSHGGTDGRNFGGNLRKQSRSISISALAIAAVAATAVGVFSHYRAAHQVAVRQPTSNTTSAQKPRRASPEALEVLAQLRNRYAPVPQRRRRGVVDEPPSNSDPGNPDSDLAAATQASPLLPGLTDDFEANPAGILARFPAANTRTEAKVVLPSHANAALELEDLGTGMHVQAILEGVQDKAAEMADGYAVYREALGPNATVLRRAMPNGSEDFVSFAAPPSEPSITYHMGLDSNVAGLRLAGNSLELLDKDGTPRLRVAPPYIVGADGEWLEARLTIGGCAADMNPSAPWDRTVTAPGATSCQLRVSWDNDAVEYPALLDPTWMTTGSMTSPRQGHTATLLSTGKVLVAGGTNGTTALATAELYDRNTGTWAATGSFTGARQWHSAVLLNTSGNPTTSGKVLIAGGRNGSSTLNTAQLYSPSAGTWMAATNLNAAREQNTATVLASGKVLVTGGINGTTVLATAATYDPSTGAGTWTATTAPMPAARKFHAATLISTTNPQLNGKVLVTGGNNGTASQSTVYLYDPAQSAFSTLTPLTTPREGQTATVLSNTKILLAGGKNGSTTLNTAVVFDPTTGPGSWSAVGNMTAARQGHSASLLSSGQVLVAGGSNGTTTLSSAEQFNGTNSWTTPTVMPGPVQAHTATVLGNNIVLIAGGLSGTTTQNAARLYDTTGGTPCTSGSQCLSGTCVSGVCCNTACTDQCSSCNLAGLAGICSPKPNGATCNDGNLCTQTDTCQAGACTGANPVTCTAQDQCHTAGTCNTATGTCSNPNKPAGTPCPDNTVCNGAETCNTSGTCVPGTPLVVDDGNPCTADSCDAVTGVSHTPLAAGSSCADGTVCNGNETCNGSGTCVPGTPLVVDDGNPCTADACDPVTGASHTPLAAGTSCTDGNACNGVELCDASATCLPGTPPLVEDGNPCTADSCDAVAGVSHLPVPLGTSCADGTVCNGAETCNGSGTCVPGTPLVVDDNNPCTTDACDAIAGATHTPVAPGTTCTDGNICTGAGTCNATGTCMPGTIPTLDDGNPCTADSCDPVSGVHHDPVAAGTSCADSNLCNGSETCNASGSCIAGTPPSIDDGNPCTTDACDPGVGITYTPVAVGTPCPDANSCNGNETCSAGGTCMAGTPPTLDDGNPCTVDSCDPATGAIAHDPAPAGSACSSSDVCYTGQTCGAQGQCQGGAPANVDDGDPSTIDTCVPGQGVRHRKAAAIDKTVITTTLAANQWLYTGNDPIQTGVAPGTIELRRAAVLHGYVKDRQGQPIPNVTITVLGHPEFGTTITHADGRYDMVVNGGGQLTVKYTKTGLLEAQRNVNAPWDDHTWATDVVQIPADPIVTSIDLTSAQQMQVAQGSANNDADGDRQATVMFPVDNIATATLPDGTTQTQR